MQETPIKPFPDLSSLSSASDWVQRMNAFGKQGEPFLFILDFSLRQPVVLPLREVGNYLLRFKVGNCADTNSAFKGNGNRFLDRKPISFETYKSGFDQVMKAIHHGDTYLLNLCYTTPVTGINHLEEVYHTAKAPYKLWWPEKFVLFSPEQFVSIAGGVIRTFPMKGTIDASIPNAPDLLLHDLKEKEEHATVVDLLRNDLSIVASKVTVDRYRFLSEIKTGDKTLLQTSSEISGRLPDNYKDHLGDILHALLPAGSVTGAPKKRTVELIESIEPEPRNFYTGVFGIFDGISLESAVMIRMIEQRGHRFYYRSGGGITYLSNVHQEYQEMIDKVYIPV